MFEKKTLASSSSSIWPLLGLAVLAVGAVIGAVILLTPDSVPVNHDIEGLVRAGDDEFDRHREVLKMENQSVGLTVNFTGKRAVTFTGNFYNGTDRPLDAVELKLSLFNFDDPVGEIIRLALRPDSRRGPIPAGKARKLGVYVEDLPEEWRGQHAEMEIHGFRYAR